MITYANYASVITEQGLKIFRYDTTFVSENGPGDIIGLVYLMNPGEARPVSEELFYQLNHQETATQRPVETVPDKTMARVIKFIELAYKCNNMVLPKEFTVQVENLFNIREKNNEQAKKYARELIHHNEIMFRHRTLEDTYSFVWIAWGKDSMGQDIENLMIKYPNAIVVNKENRNNQLRIVPYPKHPLYMNESYFLEACQGKIM